ncbi:MAG: glutathione S-transferase [Halioglobus sp.]|jgi:glutathione S-transferase
MVQLLEEDIQTKEVLQWRGVHLIHFQGSSCSQKARIFLNLKGIDWQSHSLNIAQQDNYKPWFLGINPRGLVPVLVHDGVVQIESNDILQYLDDTFPAPRLIPEELRAEIITSLREEDDLHLDLRALTMRFVFPKFLAQKRPKALALYEDNIGTVEGDKDPHKEVELTFWHDYAKQGITDAGAKDSAEKFHVAYQELEKHLAAQPYLCGTEITLLDIAWFIYTHRLTEAGYPFTQQHPRVENWYQGLLAKPEFANEVLSPPPLKAITAALHLKQRLTNKTLSQIAGF